MYPQYFNCLLTILFMIFVSGPRQTKCTRTFTIVNSCKETVWPGITPGESFNGSGFALKSGQSAVFTAPDGWSGRIWGRTGCKFDNSNGTCQTGNCGTSLKCTGPGDPPATIAEFTLGNLDFYDVSLVDGFNLQMTVTPIKGKGNCSVVGCDGDMRQSCPSELAFKVDGKTVACKSACEAFNTDEYCCRGMYGNPVTCHATNYSRSFKQLCPAAYSYAFDDPTSIFTCASAEYIVTFCASRNQTVCSYHNNNLVCSGSSSVNFSIILWCVTMVALALIFKAPSNLKV
ncbi:Thaumatin family [Dillenia turbinata]|uniref:Thaumatin family n=1 Tax=Dillenia turbinata TaxID=194707 RepID=A0AAN8WCT2_9MAGN